MDERDCPQQLLDSANMYAATTIMLDAFNECDKASQNELMDVFEHLVKNSKRPVKIFVSSRPNEVQSLTWPRICVGEKDGRNDIKQFISARIRDKHTPTLVKSMESEISSSLLSQSGSM